MVLVMLVLLPPSETKATRKRGRPMAVHELSFPTLDAPRRQVAAALATVSSSPDAAAVLKVSENQWDEIARNLVLDEAPALRASELYTGVLYDALDLAGMSPADRSRASRRLVVVSALYGLARMTDKVAPYRLSMGVNLPGIGPLASFWQPVLARELDPEPGLIVDCRSSTYVAAWRPRPGRAHRWVQISVPGATHQAKHTRGLVARELCAAGPAPTTPSRLAERLGRSFDVTLAPPPRTGRPWDLAVRTR